MRRVSQEQSVLKCLKVLNGEFGSVPASHFLRAEVVVDNHTKIVMVAAKPMSSHNMATYTTLSMNDGMPSKRGMVPIKCTSSALTPTKQKAA